MTIDDHQTDTFCTLNWQLLSTTTQKFFAKADAFYNKLAIKLKSTSKGAQKTFNIEHKWSLLDH